MAKRGPKGLTDAEKLARGTAQPSRLGNVIHAFDVVENPEDLPEPPDWFLHLEDEWPSKKYAVAIATFAENRDRLFAENRLQLRHIEGLSNYAVLQAEFFMAACKGGIPSSLVAQITTLQKSLGILPDGKATTDTPVKPGKSKYGNNGPQSRANPRA